MKYAALKSYLAARKQARLRMSFTEIAKAAGTKLPASAYRHPAWWANDPKHHVQARAWTEAGFAAGNVDVEAESVEFVRVGARGRGVREMPEAFAHEGGEKPAQHPLIGWMKGTFTIEPGWDITKPALDADELAAWEANIDRMADRVAVRVRRKKK
jgi:hypothetical protein